MPRGRPAIMVPGPPVSIEEGDALIVTVRLASGHFESTIQVPLRSTPDEKKAFIDAWFALIEAGIKCGQSARKEKEPPS